MFILMIFLPLLSFFVLSVLGRFFSKNFLLKIVLICFFIATILSFLNLYEIFFCQSSCLIPIFNWIILSSLNIEWYFQYDNISSIMFVVVLFISSLVHYYSIEYMLNDPFIIRFISYLSLFTFFMLLLVSAGNYVQLFLGWEGVGLSSYLLINFWFTRIQANKSAIKAIIMNRFGDIALYFAIILIIYMFKTTDFLVLDVLLCQITKINLWLLNLIVLFIFIGAMGKSAQIGLHTWLPDAMEGPTPVSALIHAATMVTAGVFVLIRSNFFLEHTPTILIFIILVGSLTAFFAGSIGGFQYDLKKVIAYSTCSQLGYMVFACGLLNYELSLFHLFNHAFFKALLFLGAGSVIHAMVDEQDMRRMGGLHKILPITYITMFIGSLTLIGIPFFSGFYSKDLILEYAFIYNNSYAFWGYILCSLAIVFTSFYSIRLLYLTFHNGCNFVKVFPMESGNIICLVLTFLCIISILAGFLFREVFLSGWLILGYSDFFFNAEFLPLYIKLIPIVFIILGIFFFFSFQKFWVTSDIFHFFNQKWYIDLLYNNLIVQVTMFFSYWITFKLIDRGILESIGSFGISNWNKFFKYVQRFFSGYIYHFIFLIFLFFIYFFFLAYCFSFTLFTFCLCSSIILYLFL